MIEEGDREEGRHGTIEEKKELRKEKRTFSVRFSIRNPHSSYHREVYLLPSVVQPTPNLDIISLLPGTNSFATVDTVGP